jgi:drug/metabolite transporter (DMT)-like permease
LLAAERQSGGKDGFRLGRYFSILREDPLYRRYMACMMVLGTGNLMFMAPLILIMNRELGMTSFSQIIVTAALPTLIVPLSARYWSRVLARDHVIGFRQRNSRWYVLAIAVALAGVLLETEWILWAAAVVLGMAIGGGMLGWNLGHNDFAPEERVGDYLGLHVSLTGLRGLIAPLIGVCCYGVLEFIDPGLGRWSLLVPLTLTACGSIAFWKFHRDHQRNRV